MNKQKGICVECKAEYEYEYNAKYPRKYCTPCSAKKKAEYKAITQVPKGSPRPDLEWDGEDDGIGEAMKVLEKPVTNTTGTVTKANGKEFHLSPEQVEFNKARIKCWALKCATECMKVSDRDMDTEEVIKLAEKFVEWINDSK